MERINRHKFAILVAFCIVLGLFSPLALADEEIELTSTINSNWLGEDSHGYIVKFNRAPTANELGDIVVKSNHYFVNQQDVNQTNFSWGEGLGILEINEYSIVLPNKISYGDQVDIEVYINETIISSRTFKPVIWTQPIADHEVTLSTQWELDQSEFSAQGDDNYLLFFDGQGWQKRTG